MSPLLRPRLVANCLLMALLLGCGSASDAVKAPRKSASSSSFDGLMDDLSNELNQQAEQWPSLAAPVDENNPVYQTVDQSRARLQKAIGYANGGDLVGALVELKDVRYHPDVRDQWDLFWAEVSALRFQRLDVLPLAARFSAFSLMISPQSEATVIRSDLKAQRAWAWKYEGAKPAVPLQARAGTNSDGQARTSVLTVQGYSNLSIPVNLKKEEDSFRHLQFVVFLTSNQKYVGSYSVQSYHLKGKRVFCLQRRSDGDPQVVRLFDSAPSYSVAEANVIVELENPKE